MKLSLIAFFIFSLAATTIKLIPSLRAGGGGVWHIWVRYNDEFSGVAKRNPLQRLIIRTQICQGRWGN